jgi:hypothetical protein
MGVLSLTRKLISRKKRKKRVIKLPETYYKDYSLCESAYKALSIIAEIEKKPKKKILDKIVIWFFKGYYRNNVLNRAKLFTQNNPNIKPGEIQYYKKNHITKEANDCLSYIAQHEKMSRKKCLDNIVLYVYSYYMGRALQENNIRRKINELRPKNTPKVLPSPAVRYLRKKAVEAGLGSYQKIVRWGL